MDREKDGDVRVEKRRVSAAETLRLEDWPLSRDEALMLGKQYYVGPKPCRMGHAWLRRTDSRACVMCIELARNCNQLRSSAGRDVGNAIAERLRGVYEQHGPRALAAAQAPFDVLLAAAVAGESPEVLTAALRNAPLRTEDGELWVMTAAGRAIGREYVAELMSRYPGDAMNQGLVEAL